MNFLAVVERDYDEPILFWKLKSETKKDAIEEFKGEMIGGWCNDEDGYIGYDGGQIQEDRDLRSMKKATLYEISTEFDMPIKQWFYDAQQRTLEATREDITKRERADFERLKAKFE